MKRRTDRARGIVLALLVVGVAASSGCAAPDPGAPPDVSLPVGSAVDGSEAAAVVVERYAAGASLQYSQTLEATRRLDATIRAFASEPSSELMAKAKELWLAARDHYGRTEVYRFYDGPVDQDGLEMLINAWPLDEAYLDEVEGGSAAVPGLVQRVEDIPEIDQAALIDLNQRGGEENVSTGWHAIEFMLWGQDLAVDGPGNRPLSDYTTDRWAKRRRQLLATLSNLLVEHLDRLAGAWAPGVPGNYRSGFVADPESSLVRIVMGVGELTRGELAGERLTVPYEERSQEEEHSCFSDNTTADLRANIEGIAAVLRGAYGDSSPGAGFIELVRGMAPAEASELDEALADSIAAIAAIEAPFDRHLQLDLADDDPGRQAVFTAIRSLETLSERLVAAMRAVGIEIGTPVPVIPASPRG